MTRKPFMPSMVAENNCEGQTPAQPSRESVFREAARGLARGSSSSVSKYRDPVVFSADDRRLTSRKARSTAAGLGSGERASDVLAELLVDDSLETVSVYRRP